MSGPKIDSVSIEQMMVMQLAAERSRNESMLHDALIKLDKKIRSLKADCLELDDHRGEVVSEVEDLERFSGIPWCRSRLLAIHPKSKRLGHSMIG